jgi:hypothetical protein
MNRWIGAAGRGALFFGLLTMVACGHSGKGANGPEQDDAIEPIRTRAAFDLGCPAAEIKVTKLQEGGMMTAASYGATCGEKRAAYLERMGTIIKQ